jgi:hypothetical protein
MSYGRVSDVAASARHRFNEVSDELMTIDERYRIITNRQAIQIERLEKEIATLKKALVDNKVLTQI